MSSRIRLGMVGGGQGAFIGAVHRIASRIDDRFELVAGALSSDADRAHASAAELGIASDRSYADFSEMAIKEAAREDGIEAVSIVTPNHMHAKPVVAFAEAGIHVICDKPLCDTLENARIVKDALAASNVQFLLTHNYTGYPLIREARALIAAGKIGDVRVVRAAYLQDWLTTDLENQGFKQAEWRTDPKRSGPAGSLGDIGTHAFQLARYVTGQELSQVAADITTFVDGRQLDDHGDILLRYANGAKGVLSCSQVCVGHENGLSIAVYGSKGSISWAQESPNEMRVIEYGQPAQIYTRGSGVLGEWAMSASRTPPGHPEGYLEAFAQLYSDIADRILNVDVSDKAPVPDIDDGLTGMSFMDAALRSSANAGAWTDCEKI